MRIERIWAMPSGDTFSIKPIKALIERRIEHPCIDPFARNSHVADVTNDLDPDTEATFHLSVEEFLTQELSAGRYYQCALFDPPYSVRQINELYRKTGREKSVWSNSEGIKDVKTLLAACVVVGGIAMSFGWTSGGLGMSRGFELDEVLLVPHGGMHNDTIVTVERKVRQPEKAEYTADAVLTK